MPNAEATAATAAAAAKRSETRTSLLPRQAPPRPAIGFRGCMVRSTPLLTAGAIGFDRLNEARPLSRSLFRSPSGHRTTPLLIKALACHHAITCGLGLLLRNAGGDIRFLAIDAAKADIAISPSWPRRERSQFTCAIARPSGLSATSAAPQRNEKPNFSVSFKSRPPCSVIRRGLTRRVGSAGPAARHTTRRRPRSRRPDAHP